MQVNKYSLDIGEAMFDKLIGWFKALVGIVDKADDVLEDVDEIVDEVMEEIDKVAKREVEDAKGSTT